MKNLIFLLSFFLSFAAFAEYGQVDNECLKYGQNYVVRGSFASTDPGGKTYNLDRLISDIDKELNYFDQKPNEEKINCLRQVFEKAKTDSSQYWADRMKNEQCGDEDGLPKSKPESCSSDTWEELKKSRNNIRANNLKYNKILDACINSGGELANSCDNSDLKKLASSPIAKDMAKAKSEACCDKENGAAYQVLKTFYTLEIKGERELASECKKRTMPDKDGVLYNMGAGALECFKNLILGFCESIKKFGETLSSLNLGAATEIFRLLMSSEGRTKLASTLGQVLKSIGNQISAQFESTFSCFNGYYGVQNTCKLISSIATDFLIGGGIGKLIKTIILPVLKGVMKPFEAAAKIMKESKVGKEMTSKMKTISEAAGNKKQAVSYTIQKVSDAGRRQARSIAIAAKLRMGKPFDDMLSAAIRERYPVKQIAKAAKNAEPPPINGQFKVANSTAAKPSVTSTVASTETKAAASVAATAGDTAALGSSTLGSSAGKIVRSTITNREARSLFSQIEKRFKNKAPSKLTSEWLDKNITKDLIPEKFRRGKPSLSPAEKIQAYRESLNQIVKIGTAAERKRANRILTQLDDLSNSSSVAARTSTGAVATRGTTSAAEGRAVTTAENVGKSSADRISELPEVKLSEIVPDPSKLSSSSKSAWDELTQQLSAVQKVPLDASDASQQMQKIFGPGGSKQAERMHNNIDQMLKNKEITPEKANSLHNITSTAEQIAFNESTRPQFLGTAIITPNTNPGTFEKIVQTGKQAAKDGYNLVKTNKVGAAVYEMNDTNSNGRQSEAFDNDTIQNAAAEVEKIESNFKNEKDIENFFSKLTSREQVEDEIDKINAQISTLLGSPGELSEEHKKELKELREKLEKIAQKRITELEKSKKKNKK